MSEEFRIEFIDADDRRRSRELERENEELRRQIEILRRQPTDKGDAR